MALSRAVVRFAVRFLRGPFAPFLLGVMLWAPAYRGVLRPRPSESDVAVGRLLGSVIDDTDYHREHLSENGLLQLQRHRERFVGEFAVLFTDYAFGLHEHVFRFSNGATWYATASGQDTFYHSLDYRDERRRR